MTYYRGGLSAFGRRFRGSGLGAGTALIEPSLEQGWTAEDARMLEILGSKGTGSAEGAALIKEIEAAQGAGNWYNEWVRLQDYYTSKYMAAKSDAERLATLQQSLTSTDYGTQYVPGGAIPYSIHDINAFQAMSAEEQAAFLLAFSDPNAAGYFSAVAGTKPEVQRLMDQARGIQYMGADGKLYASYEEMIAAGTRSPGTVTVTTHDGTVLTPAPGEPLDHETVFGPGSGTTVPQWTAPTAPAPITNPYGGGGAAPPPTNGSTEGGVPAPPAAPITPPPVFVSPTKPSGTLTPVIPSGGGTTFPGPETPKTKPGSGPIIDTGTAPATAGVPGGALGVLAILGIGLALFAKSKR